MRIGFDVRDLSLSKTGIRTVHDELIREFQKTDHEIILLKPKSLKVPQTTYYKVLEHINFFLWKEFKLPYIAWKNNCDVLFCNDYVAPICKFGIRTFPFFHGTNFWELSSHYNSIWLRYFTLLSILGARRSNRIIVNSEFTSARLQKLLKFKEKKIQVIPLGGKTFRPNPKKGIILKLGLQEKGYILHVGVFEKRKNLVNLVRAFALLPNKEIKLVLVGQPGPKADMNDFNNIRKTITTQKLEDRVLMPGHLDDSELSSIYEHSILYVFPSIYEGFGIPILEAFQYNIPLISSNYGALPEVIGEEGLYFDPKRPEDIKSKMAQVLSNDQLRERLIENGKRRIEVYNWKNACDQLIKTFSLDNLE